LNKHSKQIKPFGSWKSPISGESLVRSSLGLGQLQIDGDKVFWTEGRPEEKGRTALMEWSLSKGLKEVSQPDWDVRTKVHEYGGGAFHMSVAGGFYIDNRDQQLFKILEDEKRQRLTPADQFRYADAVYDHYRNQLLVVGEDHSEPEDVRNMLLKVAGDGSLEKQVIAKGNDFFSNPRISPDGNQLLFLSWDHPNMPWDGTQLWLGDLDQDGNITKIERIAGDEDESIFQPLWDPNGDIYYISDQTGWWNIYRYSDGHSSCVLEMEAEFGLPQWIFGMSTYAVINAGELIASYKDLKGSHLINIDVASGTIQDIDVPFSEIDQIRASQNLIAFVASSTEQPPAIVAIDLKSNDMHIIRKSSETQLHGDFLSRAEQLSYESRPGELTHAWYYAPLNRDYTGPEREKPPLIVLSHGGPTANSNSALNMTIQYWTTRGFAVIDVNYSGSTGFGRKYRERLNGTWGIRDVEDCTAAAKSLVQSGRADPDRLIIKGGSAGGFTTLAALTFNNTFTAGASYFGVGDLELLARDTHKFESRYLDQLVGSYPEEKQVYMDRSPINHTDQLNCPVIFFQGLDDPVVPPNQAERMVDALKKRGVPVAYIPFEGESHGFRQASTKVKAIESEYYFYTQIFGIEAADKLETVEIFNL